MCGVVGFVGGPNTKNAKEIVIEGLKKLEYRGYDSAGIVLNINNKLEIFKDVGRIANLENQIAGKKLESNIGMGNSRQAVARERASTDEYGWDHSGCAQRNNRKLYGA